MVEDYFHDILLKLFASSSISSIKVLKQEAGDEDGYIRIKCTLSNDDTIEFAEYIQIQGDKVNIVTYNYHWQTFDGKLVKRWDNVRHHRDVDTFPNHLHLPGDDVINSNPMNLEKVLKDVEKNIPSDE